MATIHLEELRKVFSVGGTDHVAVDGISLEIPDCSFTTIVGPSGCGKTTTLRMLAGLETPTSGRIRFDDRDVTDLRPQERNVAMVFQSIALYPHMTVRENIGYALKIDGVPKAGRDEKIEEAAETLQITDQLEKMPSELSGGQQQRVALGSAFVQDPDALLLDEPMSDLDAKLKAELRVEVQRLHKELDTTVVYVTHDQTEAMTMSDDVVLLNEGRVEQFAPPTELFDRPTSAYAARFIGTPSTNVFEGTVERGDRGPVVKGQGTTVRLPADALADRVGETVSLGVRPQYVTLDGGDHGLDVTVEVVEPLGTESVVHCRTADGTPFDVVTSDLAGVDPGETVRAGFDTEHVYLFDAGGETVAFGTDLREPEESP